MPTNPTNRMLPLMEDEEGYPFDKVVQIREGVRYAQADFPGNGRFSVPAKDNGAARGGQITNYDSMGKVRTPVIAKNIRKGRK